MAKNINKRSTKSHGDRATGEKKRGDKGKEERNIKKALFVSKKKRVKGKEEEKQGKIDNEIRKKRMIMETCQNRYSYGNSFFYKVQNLGIFVKGSVRMSVRPLSFRKNCRKRRF